MLLIGKNTMISTLDVQRLVIPMVTEFGAIEVQVALKLSGAAAKRAACTETQTRIKRLPASAQRRRKMPVHQFYSRSMEQPKSRGM